MKAFIFKVFVLFILINISLSDTIEIKLNEKIKNSLSDQTYIYYKLIIPELPKIRIRRKFLLIEARKNEEQDFLDNIFSDQIYIYPLNIQPRIQTIVLGVAIGLGMRSLVLIQNT